MIALTNTTFHDAGELREYVATNYGQILSEGGSSRIYFRAIRLCRRLAKMTGQTAETVIANARQDYAILAA